MEEHIKKIEGLIADNETVKERTGYLDVSRGCLYSAIEYARYHQTALAKIATAPTSQRDAGHP